MSKVVLYTDAQDLPARRFAAFNHYLMLNAEVGATISDYDAKQRRMGMYLKNRDYDNALIEWRNNRDCFYNAITEYIPASHALACLVRSVGGKTYPARLTDADREEIIDALDAAGYSYGQQQRMLEDVKKKSRHSLGNTFRRFLKRLIS